MPNKLVYTSKPFAFENAAFGCQHDCIVQRAASRESHVSKRFNLFEKPKRPRRCEPSGEVTVCELDVITLSADHRMWELDQTRDRKTRGRTDAHSTIALADF